MSDTTLSDDNPFKEIAKHIIELFNYFEAQLGIVDPDRSIELVKTAVVGSIKNARLFHRYASYFDRIDPIE